MVPFRGCPYKPAFGLYGLLTLHLFRLYFGMVSYWAQVFDQHRKHAIDRKESVVEEKVAA